MPTKWARVSSAGVRDLARLDAVVTGELRVNLRVHPSSGIEEGSRIIGGAGPSVFGIDEEFLPETLERARGLKHVRIRGLHCRQQRAPCGGIPSGDLRCSTSRGACKRHWASPSNTSTSAGDSGFPTPRGRRRWTWSAWGQGLPLCSGDPLVHRPGDSGAGPVLDGPCGTYLARVIRCSQPRHRLSSSKAA
ncbi:MAG: hypothetical protein R3E96_00260 [Planctomycetota bacterium]